eukprot:11170829-Lingulodinium_polyedra.AAC.1
MATPCGANRTATGSTRRRAARKRLPRADRLGKRRWALRAPTWSERPTPIGLALALVDRASDDAALNLG